MLILDPFEISMKKYFLPTIIIFFGNSENPNKLRTVCKYEALERFKLYNIKYKLQKPIFISD